MSRRRRAMVAGLLVGAFAAAACSLSGTDGLSGGGSDASREAALGDASPPATPEEGGSGGPDGSAAVVNLLANGDFELGCSGGWGSNDAFLRTAESTIAHGGARGCRLCSTAFDAGASLLFFTVYAEDVPSHVPVAGGSYDGEIWVRNTGDGAPFESVVARLELVDEDAGIAARAVSAPTIPAPDWGRIAVTSELPSSGQRLRFSISLQRHTDNTACIVIDDARLVLR